MIMSDFVKLLVLMSLSVDSTFEKLHYYLQLNHSHIQQIHKQVNNKQ
jgi:hypothetical protein